MPFYEYQCQACGYAFDKLQKMSDEPLTDCPQCHAPKLKKLMSASGFQLKGDGWYVTDFKDKKPKNQTEAGNGSTGGGADSGTAAKSAAASDAPKATPSED